MKKRRLMICLTAGVLLLAVSATAAFGSVNGYAKYKNALKALALEESNVTASVTADMTMDGQSVLSGQIDYALASPDYAMYMTAVQGGTTFEEYSGTVDGVHTWYSDDSTYRQYDEDDNPSSFPSNLLGYDPDDEMANRVITFMEVAADTVVGDLKNNFVEVGADGDSTLYQVNISNSQVPSLINAGLSLFAYVVAEDQANISCIQYEDFETSAFAYYEETTGEALPEEFKEGYRNGFDDEAYETYQELLEEFWEVESQWSSRHWEILEEKGGGIVYVYADNTYDYYPDNQSFILAQGSASDIDDMFYYYIGEDMILDNVSCTFGVDGNGYLTSNQITVTFTTTDFEGGHHELVMSMDAKVSDHGTTVVPAPDLTGRTKLN